MSKQTRTSKKQIRELEELARETIDKSARLYARNEYDATGKAYSVINGTRTAYASNTALYDAVADLIMQHDEEEFAPEPEPVIYATERTETTESAPFESYVQEWETLLIQIEENELVDTRTGESYIDGYRYILCTVSKFGNISIHYGLSSSGKTFESCKRAANRMLGKCFNRRTSDIVATGSTLEAMHASFTDETVHERFKMWAAALFTSEQDERAAVEAAAPKAWEEMNNCEDLVNMMAYDAFEAIRYYGARPETDEELEQLDRLMGYATEIVKRDGPAHSIEWEPYQVCEFPAPYLVWEDRPETETPENYAAEDAATSLINAYSDAIGERPLETDPETRAAYRVAAEEIAGWSAADASDREIVASMVECIAQAVRDDMPTGPEGYHAELVRKADDAAVRFCAAYTDTTGIVPFFEDAAAVCRVARADVAYEYGVTAADREIVAAMVEELADATRRRPTYQRHELESYLGEPDDYDIAAIEHDATAYDPATGRTVWAVDSDELAEICERHQLQFYAPAF